MGIGTKKEGEQGTTRAVLRVSDNENKELDRDVGGNKSPILNLRNQT